MRFIETSEKFLDPYTHGTYSARRGYILLALLSSMASTHSKPMDISGRSLGMSVCQSFPQPAHPRLYCALQVAPNESSGEICGAGYRQGYELPPLANSGGTPAPIPHLVSPLWKTVLSRAPARTRVRCASPFSMSVL